MRVRAVADRARSGAAGRAPAAPIPQTRIGNRAVMRMRRRPVLAQIDTGRPAPPPVGTPQNYAIGEARSSSELNGQRVGVHVQMSWQSSTGNLEGLQTVPTQEEIEIVGRTGSFLLPGQPGNVDKTEMNVSGAGHIHSETGYAGDNHAMPITWAAQGEGEIVLRQIFTYRAPGPVAAFAAAPNSGFLITFTIVELTDGLWIVTAEKKPSNVTLADGRTSQAGGGPTASTTSFVARHPITGALSVSRFELSPAPAPPPAAAAVNA